MQCPSLGIGSRRPGICPICRVEAINKCSVLVVEESVGMGEDRQAAQKTWLAAKCLASH